MSKIYKWARQVLVWLGEGDPEMEKALRDLAGVSRGNLSRISDTDYPLSVLLFFEYFGRRWIIQEMALDVDVQLFFGDSQISWARICAVLHHFLDASKGYSPPQTLIIERLALLWKHKSGLSSHRVGKDGGQDGLGIFSLLESFEHSKCADSRDILYAICGLATDVFTSQESGSRWLTASERRHSLIPITIDYTDPIEQVYTQFAWNSIKAGYGLEILAARCDRHSPTDSTSPLLPSWVPDWQNTPYPALGVSFSKRYIMARDSPYIIKLTVDSAKDPSFVNLSQLSFARCNYMEKPMLAVRAVCCIPQSGCLEALRDFMASYSMCSQWGHHNPKLRYQDVGLILLFVDSRIGSLQGGELLGISFPPFTEYRLYLRRALPCSQTL
jgi:hypothetical protein